MRLRLAPSRLQSDCSRSIRPRRERIRKAHSQLNSSTPIFSKNSKNSRKFSTVWVKFVQKSWKCAFDTRDTLIVTDSNYNVKFLLEIFRLFLNISSILIKRFIFLSPCRMSMWENDCICNISKSLANRTTTGLSTHTAFSLSKAGAMMDTDPPEFLSKDDEIQYWMDLANQLLQR